MPITAVMEAVPVPVPELVIVPVWLIAVVERVMPPEAVPLMFRVRLPVPEMPPDTVNTLPAVEEVV